MSYMQDKLDSNKISIYKEALKYSKEILCEACNGAKINPQIYKNLFIGDISFYDFFYNAY